MRKKKPYNPIPQTKEAKILHTPANSPQYQWTLMVTTNKNDILFFNVQDIKRLHYLGLLDGGSIGMYENDM